MNMNNKNEKEIRYEICVRMPFGKKKIAVQLQQQTMKHEIN